MDHERIEDGVIEHLYELARAKRAILTVVGEIADTYPTQANTLLSTIAALTRSANKLLSDTTPNG